MYPLMSIGKCMVTRCSGRKDDSGMTPSLQAAMMLCLAAVLELAGSEANVFSVLYCL